MRICRTLLGLALPVATMVVAIPAFASVSEAPHQAGTPAISERIARDIAWSFGIVRIDEIARDGMRWEIAGHDQDGNERMLDISAYDGRLLN